VKRRTLEMIELDRRVAALEQQQALKGT